jgi:hypothetical protein
MICCMRRLQQCLGKGDSLNHAGGHRAPNSRRKAVELAYLSEDVHPIAQLFRMIVNRRADGGD